MTAVLNNLRQLEAANRSGALSKSEYEAAKNRILSSIEDAELITETTEGETCTQSCADTVIFLIMAFAGLCVFTALVAWAIGDLTIALTLSITILAGLTIHAFQRLQKE